MRKKPANCYRNNTQKANLERSRTWYLVTLPGSSCSTLPLPRVLLCGILPPPSFVYAKSFAELALRTCQSISWSGNLIHRDVSPFSPYSPRTGAYVSGTDQPPLTHFWGSTSMRVPFPFIFCLAVSVLVFVFPASSALARPSFLRRSRVNFLK